MTDVAPSIALLLLSVIRESPTNPRKTFEQVALDELTASVREKGILQPVLVRPAPAGAGYELVFGHRRVRAARAAGLTHVPAMVASMDDRAVLEAQVVENQQRTDVHPLEEAEGYQRLHETYGDTIEEIAAKVGKSPSYVYKRLKLCSLCEAGRDAFYSGTIDASRALLLARIPDDTQQAQALDEITVATDGRGGGLSLAAASEHIRATYMRRLAEAPFNPQAASLTSAGACSKCPKRSGAQPELFSDVPTKDVCTDLSCWREKTAANWLAKRNEAFAAGRKVLGAEEAKGVFLSWEPDRVNISSGYVSLDSVCQISNSEAAPHWRELLEKLPEYRDGNRTLLAQSGSGRAVELVVLVDAREALTAAGLLGAAKPRPERPPLTPEEEERNRARELEARVEEAVHAACVTAAEGSTDLHVMKLVIGLLSGNYSVRRVLERRGWEDDDDDRSVHDILIGHVFRCSSSELHGLIVEIALADANSRTFGAAHETLLADVCEHLEVDRAAVERTVREEAERERAKAEKTAKKRAAHVRTMAKKAAGAKEVADAE